MLGLHFFKRLIGLCFPKTEVSKRPRNRTDRFGLTERPPLSTTDSRNGALVVDGGIVLCLRRGRRQRLARDLGHKGKDIDI
jgi:hypothetical protein